MLRHLDFVNNMLKNRGKSVDAPRPSSLRSLVAWFFVLSFGDYEDGLDRSSAIQANEENLIGGHSAFESRLRQLVWWPPDVFALTSSVLMRTGAYRLIVGPDSTVGKHLWLRLDWPQRVEAHAEAWRSVISRHILEPVDLEEALNDKEFNKGKRSNYQIFADKKLWERLRERIKDRCERRRLEGQALPFEGEPTGADRQPDACDNLLDAFIRDIVQLRDADGYLADQNLLAVGVKADTSNQPGGPAERNEAARFIEAIIGLHILADAASGAVGMPRRSTHESAVFDGFANVLLALRGSLSTAPKFFGVVLPKMRTPQKGLTLRNLSHNLTYHDCEVEVMWRSFPWANFDENTLNILYIPYPFDFDPNSFKGDTEHFESVGYFTYEPGEWKDFDRAVRLIKDVRDGGIAPHFLVFTETAFHEKTYFDLLKLLSKSFGSGDPRFMPVVVAGVSRTDERGLVYNELRLATHFAGKWYELKQQKHHRWQLDEHQIRQYGLQGHLSTARPLFERNIVGQRRLTFYAPTPWLVLCPLICEDLARIEPVSELIRGVGPTLVLALLLDGPQLAQRWPARYASVLADDPGTGVLTVTSYGAANASRPASSLFSPSAATAKDETSRPAVVASWKDPTSSFLTLPANKHEALLVTLTARAAKEFTLDNRASNTKAVSFRLDGVKSFELEKPKKASEADGDVPKVPESPPAPIAEEEEDPRGNWSDIREVTAMTYVASAALSLLRPHLSQHPKESKKYTDKWDDMWDWNRRCLRVRQLIDVMLGRPVLVKPVVWQRQTAKEIVKLQARGGSSYHYFNTLKAKRNLLLKEIFADPKHGHERANNRHLFAVMGVAQSTLDVKVRHEEKTWPTNSLRYASTVLRILFDTIAGKDIHEDIRLDKKKTKADSHVYRRRLIIAGSANRLGSNKAYQFGSIISDGAVDVRAAPKPLTSYSDESDRPVKYLNQFSLIPPPANNPDHPTGKPNRYDFYRLTLELIEAILDDNEAALWKRAKAEFTPHQVAGIPEDEVEPKEMWRLTFLILMMVPALIHEQLEFDYVRLKEKNETALSGNVMHSLMKKSQQILTKASGRVRIRPTR